MNDLKKYLVFSLIFYVKKRTLEIAYEITVFCDMEANFR